LPRLLLLGLLAFGLVLGGLATLQGEILALALPLVVYVASALLFGPGKVKLQVARSLSTDRVQTGTPVRVLVTVVNEGPALEEIAVRERFLERQAYGLTDPPRLIDGEMSLLARLPRGGSLTLDYTVLPPRGGLQFHGLEVAACDHLGLVYRRQTIPAPGQVSVLPRGARLRSIPIRPRRTRGYAGPIPARQGGSGTDFFGVREYQMGDPRRWINWRVSARQPHTLFANEFEQERIADVGLILDARQRSNLVAGQETLFEYAVRATASLAETFLADGNRVGLLSYGRTLDWTFPGYGKVQRERILRALARARPGESQIFDNLRYLPTRFFPAQSQLVLVSPLWSDDLPMLVRLRAHGYQVLVVRPDPASLEIKIVEPGPEAELAARIIRVERALLLRRLLQMGVQVVNWPVDEPLDRAIHTSLGRAGGWTPTIRGRP
jgi:uncharacterized protein (DUF58 family)